ncbi:hypothetical protein Y032_0085g1834 [Ancylostoma ceylanicum]|uniref:Uncharacterized protein n=1 Tax=Ancylostoma ceylanicum TaxID=53326 RepID=A0A016TQZ4_9BILA|nr:hypothetical protein Y032_0085g1834 [Ancylostoma ceylanicum]
MVVTEDIQDMAMVDTAACHTTEVATAARGATVVDPDSTDGHGEDMEGMDIQECMVEEDLALGFSQECYLDEQPRDEDFKRIICANIVLFIKVI